MDLKKDYWQFVLADIARNKANADRAENAYIERRKGRASAARPMVSARFQIPTFIKAMAEELAQLRAVTFADVLQAICCEVIPLWDKRQTDYRLSLLSTSDPFKAEAVIDPVSRIPSRLVLHGNPDDLEFRTRAFGQTVLSLLEVHNVPPQALRDELEELVKLHNDADGSDADGRS